jgi:hypothetical protein
MKALLVRIGVDQAYGGWNAPVDAEGRFVYVPIPEKLGTPFMPGLERRYGEILPALERFCAEHDCDLYADLRFPKELLHFPMHLDPDFECVTYGNRGNTRGQRIVNLNEGDLLVFYGGLRPVQRSEHRLIYALVGTYVVEEVLLVEDVPQQRRYENAQTRRKTPGEGDLVVRAKPDVSGRFERCIPIGEWLDGAYRVREDILDAWGGLSVKDGFIQRSAVPPLLNNRGKGDLCVAPDEAALRLLRHTLLCVVEYWHGYRLHRNVHRWVLDCPPGGLGHISGSPSADSQVVGC